MRLCIVFVSGINIVSLCVFIGVVLYNINGIIIYNVLKLLV